MPAARTKSYTGSIQAGAITLNGDGYDSCIIAFDELSATTGTITATITPVGLTEARTPASGHVWTVGTTTDFLRIEKADFGNLILTPATVDSAMSYKVKFYNLGAAD